MTNWYVWSRRRCGHDHDGPPSGPLGRRRPPRLYPDVVGLEWLDSFRLGGMRRNVEFARPRSPRPLCLGCDQYDRSRHGDGDDIDLFANDGNNRLDGEREYRQFDDRNIYRDERGGVGALALNNNPRRRGYNLRFGASSGHDYYLQTRLLQSHASNNISNGDGIGPYTRGGVDNGRGAYAYDSRSVLNGHGWGTSPYDNVCELSHLFHTADVVS